MIDPLGPDPTDPLMPARQVAEIVSEFETPGSSSPLRPKVRYANYDSPEAQRLIEDPPRKAESPRVRIMPRVEGPPRIQEAPPSPDESAGTPSPSKSPSSPSQSTPSQSTPSQSAPSPSAPRPASTALARPLPPKPSKLERAMSVAKTVLPLVGKMLPLLEGNVAGAASNLLASRQMHEVDLKPLEESIARLQADHRALAFHSNEQKRAIQRLEDDFAALQDSVHKHAADQAELIEHVAKLAKRTSSFMRLITILLVVSILFTALLCVRIAYLIRF